MFMGFPGGSEVKASASNAGNPDSIPGLGRSPGEGNSYPFQYFGLENSMDPIVHEVAKSQTQLRAFTHSLTMVYNQKFHNGISGFMKFTVSLNNKWVLLYQTIRWIYFNHYNKRFIF